MEVPFLKWYGGMALTVSRPKQKHFISCQANLHRLHDHREKKSLKTQHR